MPTNTIKTIINIPAYSLRMSLNKLGIRNKKVFVIGFNKSASSSFHSLFKSLGRPSYHGTAWRKLDDQKLFRKYDCFSDGIPRDLSELDQLFPGSKFILNVRDMRSWIYSRLAHIEREKRSDQNKNFSPDWNNTEEAIKIWITKRNEYHIGVLSYFSERPMDILIVNFIRDEYAATKVCEFLGHKGEYQRPKKNVNPSKERPSAHTEMLHHCITELGIADCDLGYDIYCPSIENEKSKSRFPADTIML